MIDTNIFYEKQLNNPKVTWELLAQPWVIGQEGMKVQETDNIEDFVPILRGIISETEFGISGSHDFSPTDLGGAKGMIDSIIGTVNNVSEVSGVWRGGLSESIGNIKLGEKADNKSINEFVDTLLNKVDEKAQGSAFENLWGTMRNGVGARVVTALDKVSVFKGTNLEITLPSLETRIYSDTFKLNLRANNKTTDNSNGRDTVTVNNQSVTTDAQIKADSLAVIQKELFNRFIGPLNPLANEGNSVGEYLNNVFGAQLPPNGYIPSFQLLDVNKKVTGAFALRYGSYVIPNLLVSGFRYRVSTFTIRQRMQSPKGNPASPSNVELRNISGAREPLYIDVSVNLQPCTYISKQLIEKVLKLNTGAGNNS